MKNKEIKQQQNTEASNDFYTLLPTVDVEKINFMAELPEEVFRIVSVDRKGLQLCNTTNEFIRYETYRKPLIEYFATEGNKIYFSGAFSRWWILRVFQTWKERRNPTLYTVKYLTDEMANSYCV